MTDTDSIRVNAHPMPRMAGARSSAQLYARSVPVRADGMIVLDASGMDAASQSFADELIEQLLRKRMTEKLTIIEPTDRFARHVTDSARRRGLSDRLVVIERANDTLHIDPVDAAKESALMFPDR